MTRLLSALLILLCLASCFHRDPKRSIVLLLGNMHACTGFQVEAPSGKDYLVTAGHCSALEDERGSVTAITEDGATVQTRVVALDTQADILLLEPIPNLPGLPLADNDYPGEYLHVIGHGDALPLWEVDGRLIGDIQIFQWLETMMSGGVAPGHSGSPVLDVSDHVVGVVSVSDGQITGFASLLDLQAFLKGY